MSFVFNAALTHFGGVVVKFYSSVQNIPNCMKEVTWL